jgi:anti-sigma factor RsiW
MSDERVLELLSAAADGELNDAEQTELDGLLEASPEAYRFREDLDRIGAILRKVPDRAPPEMLHDRIMRSVSLPAIQSRRPRAMPGFGWFRRTTPPVVLRYGMAAAAGLLVAAAFYESRGIPDPADLSQLVGSMAPARTAPDVLDTYAFHAPGIASEVTLERRNGLFLLDIRVDSALPVDISVDLASAGVRLQALAQTEDSLESIEIEGQILQMRAHGRRQLTALLERTEVAGRQGLETINLEFSSEGMLLQRGSLTPAW